MSFPNSYEQGHESGLHTRYGGRGIILCIALQTRVVRTHMVMDHMAMDHDSGTHTRSMEVMVMDHESGTHTRNMEVIGTV